MPKNIKYRPVLLDELITDKRLKSYEDVFKTTNDLELIGAYLWNDHVCSAFYPLLGAAEITLRNSIDSALSKDKKLKNFWWRKSALHYNSFSLPEIPYDIKALRNNFSKAAELVQRDKKSRYKIRNARPTHHEIIAKTEFSTWEFILSKEFMGPNLIWPKHLGKVFTGKYPSKKTKVVLLHIKDLVKTVREFRNRVSHHEPIWKRYGVKTETDAINHLHEKIDTITQLIEIISPEKVVMLNKHGVIDRLRRACSLAELKRFQNKVDIHNVKSMTKLSRLVKQSKNEDKIQKIALYKLGKIECLIHPN